MLKFEFDVDLAVIWTTVLIAIITLSLLLFDVLYFVRAVFTVLWGRIFEDQLSPEDVSTIYGMCTTNDLDILMRHMNNARYVRELDFARFRFYDRSKIHETVTASQGVALQSANIIRYRRSIPLFTAYKITTRLVYWDEKAIYLEQQFITLRDGFIRAVSFSKQGIVGVNVHEMMIKLLNKDETYKPELTPDLKCFIECLDVSSMRLRKKDD